MPDKYEGFESLMSQSERWKALAAFNAVLAEVPKGIYCNAAGSVTLMGSDGNKETFAVAAGQTLDLRPIQVASAGTTLTTAQIILLFD